jgi:hypothetical protein
VSNIWDTRNTYLAELQTMLLPFTDQLHREDKTSLLDPFFLSNDESNDWRHSFLPLENKTVHIKRLYDAWSKHISQSIPVDDSLLGMTVLKATAYPWTETDPKSRKAAWFGIIKAAVVEHQRIKSFREDIVTKTFIGRFRHQIETDFAKYAVVKYEGGNQVFEWSFSDGISVADIDALPPLPVASLSKRLVKVNAKDKSAAFRSDILKLIRTVKSLNVANISGEKNTKLEKNIYFILEDLINVSFPYD